MGKLKSLRFQIFFKTTKKIHIVVRLEQRFPTIFVWHIPTALSELFNSFSLQTKQSDYDGVNPYLGLVYFFYSVNLLNFAFALEWQRLDIMDRITFSY